MAERKWYQSYFQEEPEQPKKVKKAPGFTANQRRAIIRRDNGHSQMRHYDEKRGFYKNTACPYDGKKCNSLRVHHIVPRGAGGKSVAENGITIFACEHEGFCPEDRLGKDVSL